MRLAGKHVLVTGASSGIGAAIAVGCAREGADVAVTYRGNAGGRRGDRRRRSGRSAAARRCCAWTSPRRGSRRAGRGRCRERFGWVDAWINNAGADILTGAGGRLSRLEKLDRVLAVDLRGTIVASWAAVEHDAASGAASIINMSWDHVTLGMAGENPILYSAAKGGIASFSRSLARAVAPAHPGEHPGAGLHRDRVRRGGRRGLAPRGRRADAAAPLGRARGLVGRGRLPGLRRVELRDGPDDHGERRRGDVDRSDTTGAHDAGNEREDLQRDGDRRAAEGAARLVLRGWLDPPGIQDRRLADHPHAGERRRLPRRGGLPPPRPHA